MKGQKEGREEKTRKPFSIYYYFENIYNAKRNILNLTSFYDFQCCPTFIFSVPFIFLPSEIIRA